MTTLPRLLLAAPASGGGKTTVATGLMAALAKQMSVAPFKVGPDYIDPSFHRLATGRPGRNLDAVLCGEELIVPLLLHGAEGTDLAIIEGVMGMFDGQLGTRGRGSSAHVATLTGTPLVLVIDCSHGSRTHAAVAAGLASFDSQVPVAGVVLNQVASPHHAAEITTELERIGLPIVGVLPRDQSLGIPSRHLGLVPAEEYRQAEELIETLAAFVERHLDLERVLDVTRQAQPLEATAWEPSAVVRPVAGEPLVAVAGGQAFTFCYPETIELLLAAGCRVASFDPLHDPDLPAGTAAVVVGGGFPELHALELASNQPLLRVMRDFIAEGGPVVAESAGTLWLAKSLDGHPMTGAIPAVASRSSGLSMGYRSAVAPADTLLAQAGQRITGHLYHRTSLKPTQPVTPAWRLTLPSGEERDDGVALASTLHASYLHLHWAAFPQAAQLLAEAAAGFTGYHPRPGLVLGEASEPNLDHHGDQDLGEDLLDFAVNVAIPEPPEWLRETVVAGANRWAAYPDAEPARQEVAQLHGLCPEQVLPTAGAAEAFTLLARTLKPRCAVVIHPQFTEPEAALRAAGHEVQRVVLGPADGFSLDPERVPREADLLVLGNPTNPTGVLHPARIIEQLRAPGRVLVADEAFMDLADHDESLLGGDLTDVLVLRSLTKTYGVAGLRVGYVAGDPALIAALAAQQPPWSVSSPALAAMLACCGPRAAEHAARLRAGLPERRADLVRRLRELGLEPVASRAPFVLVETSAIDPRRSLRPALAELGLAARRGESFPGLGATWLRLAVRDAKDHAQLADALARLIPKGSS